MLTSWRKQANALTESDAVKQAARCGSAMMRGGDQRSSGGQSF